MLTFLTNLQAVKKDFETFIKCLMFMFQTKFIELNRFRSSQIQEKHEPVGTTTVMHKLKTIGFAQKNKAEAQQVVCSRSTYL